MMRWYRSGLTPASSRVARDNISTFKQLRKAGWPAAVPLAHIRYSYWTREVRGVPLFFSPRRKELTGTDRMGRIKAALSSALILPILSIPV
jgi:hypothetical protein